MLAAIFLAMSHSAVLPSLFQPDVVLGHAAPGVVVGLSPHPAMDPGFGDLGGTVVNRELLLGQPE